MKWSSVFVLVFPEPAAAYEKVICDNKVRWGIIPGNTNQSWGRVQINYWNVLWYGLCVDYKTAWEFSFIRDISETVFEFVSQFVSVHDHNEI